MTSTLKPSTSLSTAVKPALKHEIFAPASSKSAAPSMKPDKSTSTILRPAKFLLKPAIEAPRKRLCSNEEVQAKKQLAIETRKRKQSEQEALETRCKKQGKWEKIINEESKKY